MVNRIEDYPENECIEIAQDIAAKTSQSIPKAHQQAAKASKESISALAQSHYALVRDTTAKAIATPTTRQLRRAVVDHVHDPKPLKTLMDTHYLYYQEQL